MNFLNDNNQEVSCVNVEDGIITCGNAIFIKQEIDSFDGESENEVTGRDSDVKGKSEDIGEINVVKEEFLSPESFLKLDFEILRDGNSEDFEHPSTSKKEATHENDLYENIVEPIPWVGGWKRISDVITDARPQVEPTLVQTYSGVNPAVGFSESFSVLECVKKFISGEIVSHIVTCTNERAKCFFDDNPTLNGIIYSINWCDVTENDMFVFLALYFYTGECKFSEMNQYWARKPFEPGIHFFCSSVMSRDRYRSIMKFLRFTSVNNVKKNVPSTHLDSFCDKLRKTMMKNVDAGQHIAIDEALVLWKGRLGFRQFIKAKRSRFGIKVFVMCNSDKAWSGYCYNFSVYYGKYNTSQFALPDVEGVSELSSSEKIVVHLTKSVLGQGRHIFVDNWYASTRLAEFLQTQRTMMTGTLCSNRGVPAEISKERLNPYEAVFIRKENALIVKWQDKREVYVITTKYVSEFVENDKTLFGGARTVYKKPLMIEKYNEYMDGVDKADQMLEPVDPSRKSLAWFKKLGLHLLMRLLLNSFLVYKNVVKDKCSFKRFIIQAVEQMIETHSSEGDSIKKKYIASNLRLSRKRRREDYVNHALIPLQSLPGSSSKPRKRCRVCYPEINRLTRNCCDGCPEKPGLCSIEHFNIWHKRVESTSSNILDSSSKPKHTADPAPGGPSTSH